MSDATNQLPTDPQAAALANEVEIFWDTSHLGLPPLPDVIHEVEIAHSYRWAGHPTASAGWKAGRVIGWSNLRHGSRQFANGDGRPKYIRRLWFVCDPSELEREPRARGAIRVIKSTITAGKSSQPA